MVPVLLLADFVVDVAVALLELVVDPPDPPPPLPLSPQANVPIANAPANTANAPVERSAFMSTLLRTP